MIASVLAVAAAVAVASVSWFLLQSRYDGDGAYDHHYYVRILANSTEEYVVRLPVPVDAHGIVEDHFVQDLVILSGNATFALGEFDHGTGIEIHASGHLEFEWTKEWPVSAGERYDAITMTTGAGGLDHAEPCVSWIYSDRSDISIWFLFSSIHEYKSAPWWTSGGGPTYSFCEYPEGSGWQQIPMGYGWLIVN